MTGRLAATLLVICILVAKIAAAQSVPPGMTPAEAAAWSAITAGKAANFNAMCGKIGPEHVEPADPCRTIGHGFLETILTETPFSSQIPREGVHIEGAFIRGPVDLSNGKIGSEVALVDSVLPGGLNLDRATIDPLLNLNRSTIGFLRGERVSIVDNLWVRDATVTGPVNLLNAKLGNQIAFDDSRFADAVTLGGASLGGDLVLSGAQFSRILRLEGTRIGGSVSLLGAQLAEALLLERAQIEGDVRLSAGTFEGPVSLARANVRGDLILGMMPEALGQKRVPAAHFLRAVVLDRTIVAGNMDIRQTAFDLGIELPSLHVGGTLDASDASFAGPWVLSGATLDGTLNLFGVKLSSLNLGGASVGELALGAPGRTPPHWTDAGTEVALSLRNAHVGTLQDTIGAWPREINLIGFTYDRLAGLGGRATAGELQPRSDEWWKEWLARDPVYSPQPYRQLASVLALGGENDTADAVRLADRQRARAEAWQHHQWTNWALLTVLEFTVGYGIGSAAFRVVYWVVGLALLGGLVLWLAPSARRKGGFWCIGASLSRLLPVIELNPEFTEFFNDPNRERLRGWQLIFFAVLGILGALLGSVLVAAISGLTQAS